MRGLLRGWTAVAADACGGACGDVWLAAARGRLSTAGSHAGSWGGHAAVLAQQQQDAASEGAKH
eukprot:360770-Chlamydomonas_euryale.AAC.3